MPVLVQATTVAMPASLGAMVTRPERAVVDSRCERRIHRLPLPSASKK
jgi:hypothetical protein